MEDVEYVYVIGISTNKDGDSVSLVVTKQDSEGNKTVVLEETGEKAKLWLDFFYKLHAGKAQVIVDRG